MFASSLLVIFAGPMRAQMTHRLSVTVEAEGAPLAEALVQAGPLSATTDENGSVAFTLPAGEHLVRASRLGYGTQELRLALHVDTAVTIELLAEAIEEEEILVTSTRGERRIEDEPLRVEVLAQEEIEEKLLMTPGSIAMLLNETTGLRVQETSPSLGGASIRIQGLRGRYTRLLADGLPLYGGQAGALGLLQIPPMDLRQVEVIKGAASALYGASALGGVVNLISRRPADERELLLNATTHGGGDALLWLSDDAGRWGYTLLAGVHGQDRTDVDGDAWADLPFHRRASARPRLFFQSERGRGMLTLSVMSEDRRGGGVDHAQNLITRRVDGGATARVLVRDALLLDMRVSAAATRHDHRFGLRRERDRHTTLFAELSMRGQTGAHAWTAGLAVQHDAYEARDVIGFDHADWTPALFAQDEISLSPSVTLAASARVDRHSEYGTFFSPRASVLLRPSSVVALRASGGTGFHPPGPFTDETEEVGLAQVVPPQDLLPERARTVSADLGLNLAGFEANATLFGSLIEDAVAVRTSDDGRALIVNLPGETRTWGTELLLRHRREPWGFTLSHTWLNASEPEPSGTGRRTVPLTPEHLAGLVAVYEVHGSGRAGLELYYTGVQHLADDPFRTRSVDYLIFGMLFEKRFGRVRVFLNLENLTDTRQTRWSPLVLPAPGSWDRRTTDSWAPLEGRVVNGGVRLAF